MNVSSGLVVDPVEAGLDGQPGQESVLCAVPIGGGDVDGATLVVQGLLGVVEVLVPGFGDAESNPRPLVHHGDGERVQLFLATLQSRKRSC